MTCDVELKNQKSRFSLYYKALLSPLIINKNINCCLAD